MSVRHRKSSVTPEKRREWLDRKEAGESAAHIALTDHYDPRTVRNHIDLEVQERENKEARTGVLRNNLERHYADLCRHAEKLVRPSNRWPIGRDAGQSLSGQYWLYLEEALRQHMPKSPIWGLLKERGKLETGRNEAVDEIKKRLKADLPTDHRLTEGTDIVTGLTEAFTHQVEQWASGSSGLNVRDNFRATHKDEDLFEISYGAFNMGKVKKDHVDLVRETISDWILRINEWDEYRSLAKLTEELRKVENELSDEVAVIVLRRVVPGRCRYCPI